MNQNKFKILIEATPYVLGLLSFSGLLKLYVYYYYWNISITNYLSLSEVLLSFLDDLNIILAFGVIFFTQGMIAAKAVKQKENISPMIRRINEMQQELKKGRKTDKELMEMIIKEASTPGNVLAMQERADIQRKKKNQEKLQARVSLVLSIAFGICFMIWSNLVLLYLFVVFVSNAFYYIFVYFQIHRRFAAIMVVCCLLLSFSTALAYRKIKLVPIEAETKIVKIVTNNDTILTNNDLFFLGKTSEYLFLYDNVHSESKIIKMANVEEIDSRLK